LKRIQAVGSQNVAKDVSEVQIDKNNLIVTTPAYMCEKPIHKIYEGVGKMVNNVLQLTPLREE
jgi:enhancing lycopene biosynthesis protein 2